MNSCTKLTTEIDRLTKLANNDGDILLVLNYLTKKYNNTNRSCSKDIGDKGITDFWDSVREGANNDTNIVNKVSTFLTINGNDDLQNLMFKVDGGKSRRRRRRSTRKHVRKTRRNRRKSRKHRK